MYKLLLVDDELDILSGMANGIQWDKWGFEVIGQVQNGLEALECIKINKPHVVLSDIRMPQMDGVELMKYLNQNYPEIKIIISSGYSDVEYLTVSIKNSVAEYLLKPTDLDEFEQVFLKMKTRLDEEQRQKSEIESLKQSIEQNKEYEYLRILNNLVEGYVREEEYKRIINELGLDFTRCIVAVLDIHQLERENDEFKIKSSIVKYCNLREEHYKVRFFLNVANKMIGIITLQDNIMDWKNFIARYFQELQLEIYDLYGKEMSVGVSDKCSQISRLSHAFTQAENSLYQKIFLDRPSIVFYSDVEASGDSNYYLNHFNEGKIKHLMVEGNVTEIEKELDKVFSQFENRLVKEHSYTDQICLECLYNISRWALTEYNIRVEELIKEDGIKYLDIHHLFSLKEKQIFMERIIAKVMKQLKESERSDKKINSLVQAVKDYVDKEFTSNLISLDLISAEVKKSSAYLSKLFKRETGYNLSDYITQKRMELGKELLQDPALKIYEIADKIGYADVSNFIKVFKKNYGVSPSEYRNMQGRSS